MILRVTQYGESVLRQQGELVKEFDASLLKLGNDMLETMYAEQGVGLAAQQVGLALQICVLDVSQLDESDLDYLLDGKRPPIELIMPMALVNPQLELLPGKTVTDEEGCLSFPGIRGDVPRAESIRVNYRDIEGAAHILEASGWFARVIQHEVDHLQGKLFIDRMETRTLRNLDSKIRRLKRDTRDLIKNNFEISTDKI